MRLSDAAALGDSLRERNSRVYLRKNGDGWCGCAIGGAVLAAGSKSELDREQLFPWLGEYNFLDPLNSVENFGWNFDSSISERFFRVMRGDMTFEELIAYVRSVEPSCGECNRFQCSCQQASQSAPAGELVDAEEVDKG